jgi:hypothetical protein
MGKTSYLTKVLLLVVFGTILCFGQERAKLAIGYDEGLAGRFFIADNMAVQASLGFERLGGYDSTANNGGSLESETNLSFAGGFLFNLFSSEFVFLDALGQMAIAHDGTRSDDGIGSRNWFFIRGMLAPEFLIAKRVGLGMRFGAEIAVKGDSKQNVGGGVTADTDDAVFNFRFFGPQNPLSGSTLGLSLFIYL